MNEKKGNFLLGLILFLAMLLVPLLSLGGNAYRNSKQKSVPQNTKIPQTQSSKNQFHILDTSSGKILTVDDRTFLYGAVAAEMSPLAGKEALKAQAVASYTYYSRLRENRTKGLASSANGTDFSVDTKNWNIYVTKETMQSRWGGNFSQYYQNITAAADSVSGQVLRCGGSLIDATYFAISSGNTEASEDIWGAKCSYLVPVASPMDQFAGGYLTTVNFSESEMKQHITHIAPKANLNGPDAGWIGKTDCSPPGGVKTIQLGGVSLTGSQVRSEFGLRSTNFTVSYAGGNFAFTVKGYGHDVGMSQTGAEAMAQQGDGYQQILAWYYPTASLSHI